MNSSPGYPYFGHVHTVSSYINDGISTISKISVHYYKTTNYLYSLQVTDSNNAELGT